MEEGLEQVGGDGGQGHQGGLMNGKIRIKSDIQYSGRAPPVQIGQVVRRGLREKERSWRELTDGRQRGHHQGRSGFKYLYLSLVIF